MIQSLSSRAALLLLTALLHLALLWAALVGLAPAEITPPTPLPMVMAEMLPQPKADMPQPRPQPPQPEPKPKVEPPPKPRPEPKPVPKTTKNEKALTEPKPVEQPRPTQPVDPQPAAPASPAPPAPAAPPAPPAPLTQPLFNAAYLNNPPPVYPPLLRRAGEEGRVLLRVFVTADGNPGEVRVLTSSGTSLFDEAALAAVRKWRFVPARRGDTAVPAWVQVPIEFKLS